MEINTIRHAVESFRSFVEDRTGRASSNTFAWPPKLIYYYLNMFRNEVSFKSNINNSIIGFDEGVKLTIPCVELTEVDVVSECPCAPEKGVTWLKSNHPIPKSLTGVPIEVTTIDEGSTSFTYVPWNQFQDRVVNARLSGHRVQPYYTIRNIESSSNIYIYTNSPLTKAGSLISVSIVLIPKNPLEVFQFPSCGKEVNHICNPLEQEFTIEEEIQSEVFSRTLNAIASLQVIGTGVDILNNSNNDSKTQVQL